MRILSILLTICLAGLLRPDILSYGQNRREQMVFDRIGLEEGLSQLSVASIVQDRQGFIWFATLDGLNRYDGYSFRTFLHNPDDPQSLGDDNVRSIIADRRENILWIGTKGGGLSKLDPETEQFTNYRPNPSRKANTISHEEVFTIYQDLNGVIWVGTWGGGLNRFEPTKEKFTHYRYRPGDPQALGNDIVRAIYEDRRGEFWIGTYGAGLFKMDRASGTFQHFPLPKGMNKSPSDLQVMCIYEPPGDPGILWIGADGGGVFRFDPLKGFLENFRHNPNSPSSIGHDRIRDILEDKNGRLWIATYGGGLSRFDYQSRQFATFCYDPKDPNSLSSDQLMSLMLDDTGILWIGAYTGGVNKLDLMKKKFESWDPQNKEGLSLTSTHIRSFYQDKHGILWVGTEDRGLNRIDRRTGEIRHFTERPGDGDALGDSRIYALMPDSDDHFLWLASFGSGIFRLDKRNGAFTNIRFDDEKRFSQEVNRTRSLAMTSNQEMWIATWGAGLIEYNLATRKYAIYKNEETNPASLGHNQVYCVYTGRDGTLWAGTWGGGLCAWRPQQKNFLRYTRDSVGAYSLNSNRILCVLENSKGEIWVGTSGHGLCRLDRRSGQWKNYGVKDGLPNQVVYGLLEDEDQYIWLSTNRGLSRFNPAKGIFRNFTSSDGLQSNEFNGGAYYQSDNGELFFGGVNGFNCFFPREIRDNPYPPKIHLTGFRIFNQPTPWSRKIKKVKEIALSYRDNFITFEFAALNFRSTFNNHYKYKLEGFDADWVDNGNRNTANYTNLSGGSYVFKVMAANNDGIWNETPRELLLVVRPPWWSHWWFYTAMAASALMLTYFFYLFRTHRIRIRNRQLQEVNLRLGRQIEERRKVEEALRASEEKFRSIFENIIDVFYRADLDGRLTMISPSGVRLLGYDSEKEMIGQSIGDTFYANPAERAEFSDSLKRNGQVAHFLVFLKRKDGVRLSVESNARLVPDNNGNPLYVEGVFRDVTIRKKEEEEYRRLQEQLMHARKIEAVGNLAGGMAHEFNNLMSVILGNAHFIMFYAEETRNEVLKRRVQAVLRSSNRCAELTAQLLSFSRKQMLRLEKLNINDVVLMNKARMLATAQNGVEIVFSLSKDINEMDGDVEMLSQSLLSMVDNAIEAMPGGGRLEIQTGTVEQLPEQPTADGNTPLSKSQHVFLRISDNGKGMTEEVRQHIFEPFFTTKENGQGAGLSLASVYGAVRQHNGWIDVQTAPGQGSVFTVYFPLDAMNDPSSTDPLPLIMP